MTSDFWSGKRVLVTGHTGFKGGWLALWLRSLGAQVSGYALEPPTNTNLFTVARIGEAVSSSTIADIRDSDRLAACFKAVRPEIVFHLAAQPLVRRAYDQPLETFAVNVMGTVHLLETVRATPGIRAVVNVTTDKCYENREWLWGYREDEALGGHDPYSSSKSCAELVSAAYRRSYFQAAGIALATARAGNVIGGGDWAPDRLLPDFLRAIDAGETLQIRSPDAIRPWQHVLEPLAGYILLAENLWNSGGAVAEAWNFGPADEDARSVQWIVAALANVLPGTTWECDPSPKPHEANFLKLDSSKARARLGWQPRWCLKEALQRTLAWHQAWRTGEDMQTVTLQQISDYVRGDRVYS